MEKKIINKSQKLNRKIGRYFINHFDDSELEALESMEYDFEHLDFLQKIMVLMKTKKGNK